MEPTLFVDYNFFLLPDGSIMMDRELMPEQIKLKNGDIFIAYTTSGSIFFRKHVPTIVTAS
jgi:hypothetical protein